MMSGKTRRKCLIIQLILLILVENIICKSTYRVEHKLNIFGETSWNTATVKLKEKYKKKSIKSNDPLVKNIVSTNMTLSGEDAFVIDFKCDLKNQSKCNKAKRGFRTAANKISEVLGIFEGPIMVNATLVSFCKITHPDGSACNSDDPSRKKLGQAYPLSSYPAKAINPKDGDTNIYLYPQALLRQLDITNEPEYSPYDIVAEFNSDVDWYYEDDKVGIKDNQHDFIYVAVHELIHGLGFISSWRNVLDTNYEYLTPRSKVGVSHNQEVVIGWYQLQIFDKYIRVDKTQEQLKDYGNQIMEYENSGDIIRQDIWLSGFMASKEGLIANNLYKLSISGKMIFTFVSDIDNLVTYLFTIPNEFKSGTCLGHFDKDEYYEKPDFLLRPYVQAGEDIEESIKNSSFSELSEEEKKKKDLWKNSPFGPHLLSVMETIGWPTKYNTERRSVEVVNHGFLSTSINKYSQFIISTILVIVFLI